MQFSSHKSLVQVFHSKRDNLRETRCTLFLKRVVVSLVLNVLTSNQSHCKEKKSAYIAGLPT